MKTRGLVDLYLPTKVAYHLKIILAGFLVTMFFNTIWRGTPFVKEFWFLLGLVTVQLEIFMAIALRMFPPIRLGRKYKSKVLTRLVVFYLLVLIIALAFMFLIIGITMLMNNASFSDVLNHFISMELKRFLISWVIGVGVGLVFFFYIEWAKALKREQKLNKEKLIFQYETLKNQVNPHFLFNSLNTLASLVSRDPELSQKFIARFSSIYRYILEKKDRETVRLSEEIAFIKDYFFLQKIRDNGKIDLQIEIDDPGVYRVLPISLQLLVENALKHNAASMERPLKIKICLGDNDMLIVENNLQSKMNMGPSSRIGLKNLKERISLVMKKELIIVKNKDKFTVHLPIIKVTG